MGKFKDKHGNSRFSNFIKKAGAVIPEILEAGTMLASGNIVGAIGHVGELLNSGTTNPKISTQVQELLNEFELKKMEFEIEAFRIESEDRKDARKLYTTDSVMQKIFGIVFLIGYIFLSWYLLTIIIDKIGLPQQAVIMITMIWTGTSTKLGTIIDFFFGGSMKN